MKKLYICGETLTGKSHLLSLLDDHPQTIIFPYHNFGFSHLSDELFNKFAPNQNLFFMQNVYPNDNLNVPIINPANDTISTMPLGEILYFFFRASGGTANLFHSHFTKDYHFWSEDLRAQFTSNKHNTAAPFDFDLFKLVERFASLITHRNSNGLTLEQLDNFLFQSFIHSVANINNKDIDNPIFVICGANGPAQVDNLFQYYSDFKILLMKRDPIAISYANIKRMWSNKTEQPSSGRLFDLMIRSYENKLTKANLLSEAVNKYSNAEDKLKIIEFESLMADTQQTMKDIAEFLRIDFSDSLLEPSILGRSIGMTQIVDNPDKIFSKRQNKRLQNIFHGVSDATPIGDRLIWTVDQIYIKLSKLSFLRKLYKMIVSGT